jgi:L-ascorbate metabolism protein UlaG (beta-lactamase superfamily)
MVKINSLSLGQVGYRFSFGELVVYIDPYLSNYVEKVEGPAFERMFPIPFRPEKVTDADWVLVTHDHLDHCDPFTLAPLALASPQAKFVCPVTVMPKLLSLNIAPERIMIPFEGKWNDLAQSLRIAPVPAAHPDIRRDELGQAHCLGYVIEHGGRRLYHAGDTSPHEELLTALKVLAPINIAFLPVNERNFFRDRTGIIGNMSVREAFLIAQEIGAKTMVPTHWDMFAPNSVAREEIELLYRLIAPGFSMEFYPTQL